LGANRRNSNHLHDAEPVTIFWNPDNTHENNFRCGCCHLLGFILGGARDRLSIVSQETRSESSIARGRPFQRGQHGQTVGDVLVGSVLYASAGVGSPSSASAAHEQRGPSRDGRSQELRDDNREDDPAEPVAIPSNDAGTSVPSQMTRAISSQTITPQATMRGGGNGGRSIKSRIEDRLHRLRDGLSRRSSSRRGQRDSRASIAGNRASSSLAIPVEAPLPLSSETEPTATPAPASAPAPTPALAPAPAPAPAPALVPAPASVSEGPPALKPTRFDASSSDSLGHDMTIRPLAPADYDGPFPPEYGPFDKGRARKGHWTLPESPKKIERVETGASATSDPSHLTFEENKPHRGVFEVSKEVSEPGPKSSPEQSLRPSSSGADVTSLPIPRRPNSRPVSGEKRIGTPDFSVHDTTPRVESGPSSPVPGRIPDVRNQRQTRDPNPNRGQVPRSQSMPSTRGRGPFRRSGLSAPHHQKAHDPETDTSSPRGSSPSLPRGPTQKGSLTSVSQSSSATVHDCGNGCSKRGAMKRNRCDECTKRREEIRRHNTEQAQEFERGEEQKIWQRVRDGQFHILAIRDRGFGELSSPALSALRLPSRQSTGSFTVYEATPNVGPTLPVATSPLHDPLHNFLDLGSFTSHPSQISIDSSEPSSTRISQATGAAEGGADTLHVVADGVSLTGPFAISGGQGTQVTVTPTAGYTGLQVRRPSTSSIADAEEPSQTEQGPGH
jgi:hypothetical protein